MTSAPHPGTGRRTQAQRRAASERLLLRAFAELITEKGVQQTTLTDIGRRAGCSHTLVVHLFGSKVGLLSRLTENVERFYTEWIEQAATDRTAAQTLVDVIDNYGRFVHNPDPDYRVTLVLWSESLVAMPELSEWRQRWDDQLKSAITGLIRRGVRDGSVRSDVPVGALGSLVINYMRGLAAEALVGDAPATSRARSAKLRLIGQLLTG